MPVIVTGTSFSDSMQRLVLSLSSCRRDMTNMFLTYSSQKVDTHVKELGANGYPDWYHMSYPVGALLGRDFELLHAACLCAHPTIPFLPGIYARLASSFGSTPDTRHGSQRRLRQGTLDK